MGLKHYKFQPNEYVLVMKKGKIINQGLGLSFFCNTLSTGMSVIPAVSYDASFAFDDIMTMDFQRINVQGDISYVIHDYVKVAGMLDFSYTNASAYENKKAEARQVMSKRIMNLAKTSISKFVNNKDVKTVIQSQEQLTSFLTGEMTSNKTIEELGLEVVSVSILAVSPQPETKKALEAATREAILQQQDDAIYKRRNAAIEQERIVKENELNTEIKVAEKQREKEEMAIAAQMSIQEKNAQAAMQKLTDDAKYNEEKLHSDDRYKKEVRESATAAKLEEFEDKIKIEEAEEKYNVSAWNAAVETDNVSHARRMARIQNSLEEAELDGRVAKTRADAQSYANEIILKAFGSIDKEVLLAILLSGMDSKTLIAKAFNSLAENADKIGNLNISPDLLEALTAAGNDK